MKTRSGFVSNSSTSSSIIVGFDVTGKNVPINEGYNGAEDGLEENQHVIGELLTWDETDEGLSFTPNMKVLENLRKKYKLPKDLSWKIFYGTRMC